MSEMNQNVFLGKVSPTRFLLNDGLSCTSLLVYKDKSVGACIREAKFHGDARAFSLLSCILSDYLTSFIGEDKALLGDIIFVPIPLSKRRIRERGFNQVTRLLKEVKKEIPSLMISECVKRVRDTKPQTSLIQKERVENLRGAFVAETLSPLPHYILVDDVTTTGTTLKEGAAALRAAGAKNISCLTLAH